MMRPRATDASQKPTPRVGLRHLRTSSSDSDPLHHRPITEKSPRLPPPDRRSPRGGGARSDPTAQRKLGTRISDLETQLVQAQRELKCLKNQLVTTDAAKKEGQEDNNKDKRNQHPHPTTQQQQQRRQNPREIQQLRRKSSGGDGGENCDDVDEVVGKETDVFEVPMEKVAPEQPLRIEIKETADHDDGGNVTTTTTTDPLSSQPSLVSELEKAVLDEDVDSKTTGNEIDQLKNKVEEIEKERDRISQQNETLKMQLEEAATELNGAKTRGVEMNAKLLQLEKELEESKLSNHSLKEGMKELEVAKEELEVEMRKLRIQTEQWRKAADAAATVLAGDVETGGGGGGRVSARCGSMEKQQSFGGMPELPPIMGVGRYSVGYNIGSPGEEFEDGFGGNGKRKGSGGGIKMFGDLWKKKGQK